MMQRTVFRSAKFDVVKKWVGLPNGTGYVSAQIIHKPVAVVVPLLGNKLLLERQYRPALGRWFYELPAGFRDKDMPMRSLAKKELLEETGYIATKLTFLFKAYAAPGSSNELYYYYLAEGLRKREQHLERYEAIEVLAVSMREAVEMIRSNRITDGKTIQGILYYRSFCARR